MIHARFFFAQAALPLDNVSVHGVTTVLREVMIVTGAAAIVTLIVVLWAVYFRRRRRHHTHHNSHHHHHAQPPTEDGISHSEITADAPTEEQPRHRRRRRRRREHRPRNPTLAETGGLPPLRSDQPQGPVP